MDGCLSRQSLDLRTSRSSLRLSPREPGAVAVLRIQKIKIRSLPSFGRISFQSCTYAGCFLRMVVVKVPAAIASLDI